MAKEYELTELDKRVVKDLERTWEYIGYDVLQAIAETDKPRDMTRAEVIDVVSDHYVGMGMFGDHDREAQKYYSELPWGGKVRKAIQKAAFPFKRYGF